LAASADGFRIESSIDTRVAWLDVAGEVDAATAPVLDAKITEAVAAGVGEVVLRCGGLEFIDSSGLSVIVANHKRLRDRGRTLVIESPPVAARRLFEIAGLDRVLNVREGPAAK
jgi:anti-anti-sigma factor